VAVVVRVAVAVNVAVDVELDVVVSVGVFVTAGGVKVTVGVMVRVAVTDPVTVYVAEGLEELTGDAGVEFHFPQPVTTPTRINIKSNVRLIFLKEFFI
jgi:hypothetical protein